MPLTLPESEYCQNFQVLQPFGRLGQDGPQSATQSGSPPKAVELERLLHRPGDV